MLRIWKLSDQIRGPHEPQVVQCFPMVTISRDGKRGAFDVGSDETGVNKKVSAKSFLNEPFPPIDMVGGQRGIGCATGQRDLLVLGSCHVGSDPVLLTDSSDITDIVAE